MNKETTVKLTDPDNEFTFQEAEKYEQNFNEKSFWEKMKSHAIHAGAAVVYAALQLYYTMVSGRVSLREKAIIAGALGYLILPTDLIPDFLPGLGYADDISALMTVFNRVKVNVDDDIRTKARQKTTELMGDQAADAFSLPLFNTSKDI